jgi:hypothetical protein
MGEEDEEESAVDETSRQLGSSSGGYPYAGEEGLRTGYGVGHGASAAGSSARSSARGDGRRRGSDDDYDRHHGSAVAHAVRSILGPFDGAAAATTEASLSSGGGGSGAPSGHSESTGSMHTDREGGGGWRARRQRRLDSHDLDDGGGAAVADVAGLSNSGDSAGVASAAEATARRLALS